MADSSAPSPWLLGARSETGYVRSANEDRMGWTRTDFGDAFVVSDGMGGHAGGALAAQITVDSLQRGLSNIPSSSDRFNDHVRQAFMVANREVFERRQTPDPAIRDMGATAVAVVTSGTRYIVAHVGDSRAYLWRGGQLKRLTRDHTAVQSMLDKGLLTPEQAASHPDTSLLDRAMGHLPEVQIDVTDWLDVLPGDVLLLCSDGLCGFVSDPEIASILSAGGEPQAIVDRLIEAALGKGGHDNVTVQLVRYAPSRGHLFKSVFKRPAVVIPTVVVLTAFVAAALAWELTRSYRAEIETLSAKQAASAASSPQVAPSSPKIVAPAAPASEPSSSPKSPPTTFPSTPDPGAGPESPTVPFPIAIPPGLVPKGKHAHDLPVDGSESPAEKRPGGHHPDSKPSHKPEKAKPPFGGASNPQAIPATPSPSSPLPTLPHKKPRTSALPPSAEPAFPPLPEKSDPGPDKPGTIDGTVR